MSPEAIAPAPGAALRLRPREIPPSLHYLLERNADEQYHWITLLRASRPVHHSGGSSDKPPPDTTRPFIPTIPLLRSTYCEKISPFKSVQFGTLHTGMEMGQNAHRTSLDSAPSGETTYARMEKRGEASTPRDRVSNKASRLLSMP